MFKFLLGALTVAVLVGYGVITTEDVEGVGRTAVNIINDGAAYVKEQTDPTLVERITDEVRR
jgi:hypothetical protein